MLFTERHIPDNLPPEQLDDYLSMGWYRSGQSVFTCRFLLKKGDLFSVVWTRLPLTNFKFRKGQRKLLRKNKERFRVFVRPEEFTTEKEKLYQVYRDDFKERLAPTLNSSLLDDNERNIFDSWEVCIYDGDKLIGFSIFDLGKKSIQSIKAVYDPEYKKYSLGYFTMLAEMEFAIELGFDYYYSGYIVPGYSAFDYKLRAGGAIEFYEPETQNWRSMGEFKEEDLLHRKMLKKLTELQTELGRRGIPTRLGVYPLYETVFWALEPRFHLGYPLVLQVYPDFHLYRYLNFVYDPNADQYRFIPCSGLQDTTEHFAHHLQPDPEIPLITELLGMSDNMLAGSEVKEAIYRMKLWISRQMFL